MWWPAPVATRGTHAVVTLPGSKSLSNRELLLAAIADGPSTLRNILRSRDTELMVAALNALGAQIDTTGDDWTVVPIDVVPAEARINCGLAGTVMRFVPALAATLPVTAAFDGDPHARTRPIGNMLAALRTLGVQIEDAGRGTLPFTVHGDPGLAGVATLDASESSQFVSALMLAGARFEHGIEIVHVGESIPSQPHLDMTIACLRRRGVTVDDSMEKYWRVSAGSSGTMSAIDVDIEPDLSNAAPFLMLAMTTEGTVRVPRWPSTTTQPGDTLRELLPQMGAEVTQSPEGVVIRGTGTIHGLNADLHDVGELTPALAALCALAETPSNLSGIAHIRGHETDRLAALTTELRGLGADIEETSDGLVIRPAALHGGMFHTYADHRMAHAAAIIGSVVPGVEIENIATTAKTFPGFADAWSAAVAER